MKYLHLLLFFCFSLMLAENARSETRQENSNFTAGNNIVFDMEKQQAAPKSANEDIMRPQLNVQKETEGTILQDNYVGEYLWPTFENLSKLYWKKNAVSLVNDTAIDNFLLINECSLYQQFYEDDFEWLRIRKAGRKMIEEKKDTFSEKFKVVIPVDLGRYDIKRQGFPLINNSSFLDLRRVEIGGNNTSADVCGNISNIEHYPRNMILVLSKPFTYEFLKISEHIAQAYIIRQKYDPIERPKDLRNKEFNRLAFARMRITFDKYQGETRSINGDNLAIMFGRLDGIDIFEDTHEKRLLTSIDF